MEAVTILRELWRRRALVGALAIVCVLVAFSLTYTLSFPPESRKYEVAIANGRILVDTPDSQVVDVRPRGSDTLGVRANLFANLMTEGKVKSLIAEEAGLRPGELQAGVESEDGTLPVSLASSVGDPDAYALTTRIQTNLDGVLPIVELEAQAPNAKEAVTLASAAVVGLQKYLASKAATEDVPDARRLRVIGLGTPQVREVVRGPQRVVAFGTAAFLFLVGCGAIILVPAIAHNWRVAAARERVAAGAPPGQGVLDPTVEDGAAEAPARPSLRDLWVPPSSPEPVSTRPEPRTTRPTPRITGANGDGARSKAGTGGDGAHGEAGTNGDGEAARSGPPAVRSG